MKDLTKKHIADKMKELMRRKPLAKIRTTEICEKAQIDRSTFYYHFRDKYDLVAWIFYDSAFSTNILNKKEAAASLKQVKKDYLFYKRANEDNSQNPLWQYMHEYYVGRYTEIAKEKLGTDILDKETLFSIRLYSYGTIAMSRDWAFGDDPTPAEEEVDMMYQSMPQKLQDIFFTA